MVLRTHIFHLPFFVYPKVFNWGVNYVSCLTNEHVSESLTRWELPSGCPRECKIFSETTGPASLLNHAVFSISNFSTQNSLLTGNWMLSSDSEISSHLQLSWPPIDFTILEEMMAYPSRQNSKQDPEMYLPLSYILLWPISISAINRIMYTYLSTER